MAEIHFHLDTCANGANGGGSSQLTRPLPHWFGSVNSKSTSLFQCELVELVIIRAAPCGGDQAVRPKTEYWVLGTEYIGYWVLSIG